MALQERCETKFSGSSEQLMKLVESGRLQPDRLTDVLSTVGQQCRSELLMQLIVLVQQQLTAASANTAVGNQHHTENNRSATVEALDDDSSMSMNTSAEDKAQTVSTASKLTSDIETCNSSRENEMDKLLAWKNRIENASLTSNEQLNSTVNEQADVNRCTTADLASGDAVLQSHAETNVKSSTVSGDNTVSFADSSEMTSCLATDVLQSVSASSVLPHLSDACSPLLSPASPCSQIIHLPVEYPPLPTPPKPPANLLMNVDCYETQDLSCRSFAAALPHLPTLDSSAVTNHLSDVCISANTACHPGDLSVPSSLSADVSPDALSSDCAWLNISTASITHTSSHCAADVLVPPKPVYCHTSCESIHGPRVELPSTQNSVSEALQSDSNYCIFSQLKPVQEVHGQRHSKLHAARTPSQDRYFPARTSTRLKSPGTWLSRLASPAVFMLQSSVSRLHCAADVCPESVFSSDSLADELSTIETSQAVCCGQEQQHSPRTLDSRHFMRQSEVFHLSHSEVASQLNLTMDGRQLRDFDNVSSDSKAHVRKSDEGLDVDYRSIVASEFTARGKQYNDDSSRMSREKVLMRLAGMPVDCAVSDVAVLSETDATRHDESVALTVSSAQHECSSQTADNVTTAETDNSDERRRVDVLWPAVDQVTTCDTAAAVCCHSPFMSVSSDELSASSSVTVQSSQQPTSDEYFEQQQQDKLVNDDDLEEGEIVDDCLPTPTVNQRELPQATKQLLSFLKSDPVRKSTSSHWVEPHVSTAEPSRRRPDDRREREHFDKYQRTSSSRRRW